MADRSVSKKVKSHGTVFRTYANRTWDPIAHKKWREREENFPMNFGKYIGEEWRHDPGAETANEILDKAHISIKNRMMDLEERANRNEEDIRALEEYLTEIYFPPEGSQKDNLGKEFLRAVIASYEKVYDTQVKSLSNGELGWDTNDWIAVKKNKKNKVSSTTKELESRTNAATRTMKNRIDFVEGILANIDEKTVNSKLKEVNKSLKDLKKCLEEIKKIMTISVGQEYDTKEMEEALDYTRLVNVNRAKDLTEAGFTVGDRTKAKKGTVYSTIKEFNSLYYSLYKMFLVPPDIYGDVFEWSLALLSDKVPTEEEIAAVTEKKIAETFDVFKKSKVGQNTVARGGRKYHQDAGLVDFMMDDFVFEGNENSKTQIDYLKRDNKEEQLRYGNIEINDKYLKNDINTGTWTQGKTDVILTLPDENDVPSNLIGKTFNISAKNWSLIDDNDKHTLGATSIFRAISRTTSVLDSVDKEAALLDLLYAYQQPTDSEVIAPNTEASGRRPIGQAAVNNAHRIAKESIILDIAAGFSQGTHTADTLVIMDRVGKRIVVIDLVKELSEYVDNNLLNNLVIEGYDGEEITSAARTIRNRARMDSYQKRNSNYIKTLRAYLETKKATIKLNKSLHTFKNN